MGDFSHIIIRSAAKEKQIFQMYSVYFTNIVEEKRKELYYWAGNIV